MSKGAEMLLWGGLGLGLGLLIGRALSVTPEQQEEAGFLRLLGFSQERATWAPVRE